MGHTPNPCEDHMWKWFRIVGVTKKGLNLVAILEILSMGFNTLWIIYKLLFTVLEDTRFVLHFLTLAYFYSGILWTIYYKSSKIIRIAKQCDTFVGLTSQSDKEESVRIAEAMKSSKLFLGTNIMTAQVFNIAFIIASRKLFMHLSFGWPRELVFSGREESTAKFYFHYAVQTTFMVTAGICIGVNTQLLYRICFHIVVKYRLLSKRLSSLRVDSSLLKDDQEAALNAAVKDCVIHHQHLLKIFNEFKEVCGYSFNFTYFGLFASIGLSRTALIGEHPDYNVFPDFITESAYLFFQCYCLSDLPVWNEEVRFAIYETDWMWYPRSTIKMLHIIGLSTKKEPHVHLFPGGSPATLQTYGALMNASMAYFMSALIF